MIGALRAWLDTLLLRRSDAEAFTWTADDARRASARAEAATRWTWQEWRDELGTDFWTDESEEVA